MSKTVAKSGISSLWLLPAPADEAWMLETIHTLALRHGTPVFHPHLTIAGDIPQSAEFVSHRMATMAEASDPFRAVITDIVISDSFFRSFYAAFDPGAELTALRASAESHLHQDFGFFTPHISLLYGPVPDAEKQRSAAAMRESLKGKMVTFDRLVITNSANDVPIDSWTIVASVPLRKPNP